MLYERLSTSEGSFSARLSEGTSSDEVRTVTMLKAISVPLGFDTRHLSYLNTVACVSGVIQHKPFVLD